MSAQMNETTIPNISLYIPHVFPNFTEEYIAGVFESLRIGVVDHIDLVAKMDKQGKPYNAAYIHFKYWYSGTAAENIYYRVKNQTKEARIVHDDPWFWILLENTAKKYEPAARRPRIEIADLEPRDEIYEDEKEYDDEIEAAIEYEKQQAEIEAAIQFFEDEAAELELQNELFLEEENKCLHKRIAELKAENAVLKAKNEAMSERLYDAKMQKLAEEGWKQMAIVLQKNHRV